MKQTQKPAPGRSTFRHPAGSADVRPKYVAAAPHKSKKNLSLPAAYSDSRTQRVADLSASARPFSASPTVGPVLPHGRNAGARSANGSSTKARRCIRGCGSITAGSPSASCQLPVTSPKLRRSRSSTRGPQRRRRRRPSTHFAARHRHTVFGRQYLFRQRGTRLRQVA